MAVSCIENPTWTIGSNLTGTNRWRRARYEVPRALHKADFLRIGTERRDDDAKPRVMLTNIIAGQALFHVAGDWYLRHAALAEIVADSELVAGMDPADALKIGIAWGRWDG